MERIGTDQWTPNFDGVTSTFKLILNQFELPGDTVSSVEHLFPTDNCGFGWRFSAASDLNDPVYRDSGEKVATINLFFEPHLLSGAALGVLDISVQIVGMGPPISGKQAYKYTLPAVGGKYPLGTYLPNLDATLPEPVVRLKVVLPRALGISISNSPLPRTQKALADSTEGRELVDTKFYLFSHRSPERRMTRPQAIFASSSLLRGHSEYLDTLLYGDGFKESLRLELDSHSLDRSEDAECIYASDSDLESDEETDPMEGSSGTRSRSSQMEHNEEQNSNPIVETTGIESMRRFGRIIRVNDTAYTTWKALIFYLYTTEVVFRPLRSEKKYTVKVSSNATPCSPKSMYRLADKAGLLELQAIAFDAISTHLTEENILEEVFSRFTSMYPKVQEVEIEFLVKHFTPKVAARFDEALQRVVKGELPYCFDVLSVIFRRMRNKGDKEKRKPANLPTADGWGVPVSPGLFSTNVPVDSPPVFNWGVDLGPDSPPSRPQSPPGRGRGIPRGRPGNVRGRGR